MKNLNRLAVFATLILAISSLLFSQGCTKEGPIGERGPEGPPGISGSGGVYTSEWMSPPTSGPTGYIHFEISMFTTEFIEKNSIIVFAREFFEADRWTVYHQLPFHSQTNDVWVSSYVHEGYLSITCSCDVISWNPVVYRFIAIPKGTTIGKHVDLTDYRAVQRALNLKD